jgi:hypothetical protein
LKGFWKIPAKMLPPAIPAVREEENPEKNRAGAWVEQWNAKEEKELPKALRMTLIPRKGARQAEDLFTVILASLPANRYEEVRPGPVRRIIAPVYR